MDVIKSFIFFQKVAELNSFTRASEYLGVVPSAVSRQISELETWAGFRLVNRTTRSLSLTPEGHIYLEKLNQITSDVENLKSLGNSSSDLTGHISLTAPMVLGQYFLPGSISRFMNLYPNIEISVALINRIVDIIDEGFDLAIRIDELSDSSLISRTVGTLSMSTIASPQYLELHGIPKQPHDLTQHNCLIGSPSAKFSRWPFVIDGKKINLKVSGNIGANNSMFLKSLSMEGLGVARLPRYYVSKEIENRTIVEIFPEFAPPPTPISIVHHFRRQVRPALRTFIEFLATDLPQ
ncbi:MAG: LysR family transcriptional regulator [Pseudomonadota bacterium]